MKHLLIKFLRHCLRKLNGKYEMSLNEFYQIIEKYAADKGANHFEVRVVKSPHTKGTVTFDAYVAGHCYTHNNISISECISKLDAPRRETQESEVTNIVF